LEAPSHGYVGAAHQQIDHDAGSVPKGQSTEHKPKFIPCCMARLLRILLVADSHLGFDLPVRPRVERRRRGHDFLRNHVAALAPALAGEVDLVVHAGDVFHRPRVPASLAYQAYHPLLRVADGGVPVFVVPGNHERSRLPHGRLLAHPRVHVFDVPRTFEVEAGGCRVAVSGFPYERRGVRARFRELLDRSGWVRGEADVRLLCLHQSVEGATVGPGDHVFDRAPDVIRGRDIPAGFAAVLAGHIHRHQVLTADLRSRPLAAPVLYPGSVERTSTAEVAESKGYLVVEVSGPAGPATASPAAGTTRLGTTRSVQNVNWGFRLLPARPMIVRELAGAGLDGRSLETAVRAFVGAAPRDAVLRIRVVGEPAPGAAVCLSASRLREWVPETVNLEVWTGNGSFLHPPRRRGRPDSPRSARAEANLELGL
jgi:DNA repair protein SbcD/Mre11